MQDLAMNNLQWFIFSKIQPNQKNKAVKNELNNSKLNFGKLVVSWASILMKNKMWFNSLNTHMIFVIFYLANVLDCDDVESKFKLQSQYYVRFWTNAFGKGMISPLLIPLTYELNSTTTILQGWLWH